MNEPIAHDFMSDDLSGHIARLVDPSLTDAQFTELVAWLAAELCWTSHYAIIVMQSSPPTVAASSSNQQSIWENRILQSAVQEVVDLAIEKNCVVFSPPYELELPQSSAITQGLEGVDTVGQGRSVKRIVALPLIRAETHPTVILLELDAFERSKILLLSGQLTSLMNTNQLRLARHELQRLSVQHENQQQQQARLEQRLSGQTCLVQMAQRIAQARDHQPCCYEIVNQLVSYLGVERVLIFDRIGRNWRLQAISGQADFDRRSNAVKAAEALVGKLALIDQSVVFDGSIDEFPEAVRPVIEQHLGESLATGLAILPITDVRASTFPADEERLVEMVNPGQTAQRKLTGCVLAENILQPIVVESLAENWQEAEVLIANPFNLTKQRQDLFLRPVFDRLTQFAELYRGHTRRKAIGITLAILIPILLAAMLPARFRVRCEGYLQPENLQHVFAPRDARVSEILVAEGETVAAGEAMLRLEDLELESRLADEAGELEKMLIQQQALSHQRTFGSRDRTSPAADDDLAEKAASLDAQLSAQQALVDQLREEQAKLMVKAPFDGLVLGWQVNRKLSGRPIERGTRLCSIAPLGAPYCLELKVPDSRSGYVQEIYLNQPKAKQSIEATFTLASFPNRKFSAIVTHVHPGLEKDQDLGYVLPVEASPVSDLPAGLRAGLPVVAKIDCGRRSLLYCKTFEFVDWVQQWTFEYIY